MNELLIRLIDILLNANITEGLNPESFDNCDKDNLRELQDAIREVRE